MKSIKKNLKNNLKMRPPNKNIDDILETIGKKVQETPAGAWIQGYDDTLLEEKRHPTRVDLDKVSPKHPVLISHVSGQDIGVKATYMLGKWFIVEVVKF